MDVKVDRATVCRLEAGRDVQYLNFRERENKQGYFSKKGPSVLSKQCTALDRKSKKSCCFLPPQFSPIHISQPSPIHCFWHVMFLCAGNVLAKLGWQEERNGGSPYSGTENQRDLRLSDLTAQCM